MSRGWVVTGVLSLIALGVGSAFALGVFDNTEEGDGAVIGTGDGVTTTVGAVTSLATTTSIPVTSRGDDPLCVAHTDLVAALDGHLPVEGPEDLEIVRTAMLAFYTDAVPLVDPPDQDAFSVVLAYEQELYDRSESYDWDPSPSIPLDELLENLPTPPQDAFPVVSQVLEERCDVVVTRE